jgi:hypothetical protein
MNEDLTVGALTNSYVRSMEQREHHGALHLSVRDIHALIYQSQKPGYLSDCALKLLMRSHRTENSFKRHGLKFRYFPQGKQSKGTLSSAHLHAWLESSTYMIDPLEELEPADADTDAGPRAALQTMFQGLPLVRKDLQPHHHKTLLGLRLQSYVMWDAARLQGSFTLRDIDPQGLVAFDESHVPCFFEVAQHEVYFLDLSRDCKKLLAQDGHNGFFDVGLFEVTVDRENDLRRLGYALQFHVAEGGDINGCAKCDRAHVDI